MKRELIGQLIDAVSTIVLGKKREIRLSLTCLLARGHLLIEDVPGVGKTTLAHAFAKTLGLQFQRIQFTSDMLPADILGVSIFDREASAFCFHPGPIFAQMVLGDELNRASPKTQSALLEAMAERQVTTDGTTHALPSPFFVIATQNPGNQIGTFTLPESQLDRFLMRIEIGYPDHSAERALLQGMDRRSLLATQAAVITPSQLLELQAAVPAVHVSDALMDYLQALTDYTRNRGDFAAGLSPRAGLALLAAARAWAFCDGRDSVLPEDIQAVLPAVATHRLRLESGASGRSVVEQLIRAVPVP